MGLALEKGIASGAIPPGAQLPELPALNSPHDGHLYASPLSSSAPLPAARRWPVLVLSARLSDGEEIAAILGKDYDVHRAALLDGIAVVGSLRPDLVLLEWATGGLECELVCAELAAHPALGEASLLVVDAPSDPERRAAVLQAGASGFIERPFSARLIRQVIGAETRRIDRLREASVRGERSGDAKAAHLDLVLSASEVITLQGQFERFIAAARSIPWFHATGEGGILLCDDAGDPIVAYTNGIAIDTERQCGRFRGLSCACRDACAVQRPAYIPDTGELVCLGSKADPRGTHVLPLVRDGKTLGVLLLCVPRGHEPGSDETEFAHELAITAAALTSRRLMEAALEIKNYEVQAAHAEVIRLLGVAAEYRDNDTGLHVLRVGHFSRCIAEAAGLPPDQAELLLEAATMHDIGKIGIPDTILRKPGRLTDEESAQMEAHTLLGEQILQGNQPLIQAARVIAGSHHERWDGQGYPRGLKADEIPLFGRICALADVFDALCEARPYKRPWTEDEVEFYIRENQGTQFDPELVNAFFRALPEILRFQKLYGNATDMARKPLTLTPMPEVSNGALQWSDAFSVGLPIIDEHHRYLFHLTNGLWHALHGGGTAIGIAKALDALERYTVVHFSEEERLMAQHRYTHLEEHARIHREFTATVAASWDSLRKSPLISGLMVFNFLSNWIVSHVQGEDARAFRVVTAEIDRAAETAQSVRPS